jgi:hypothetical protein
MLSVFEELLIESERKSNNACISCIIKGDNKMHTNKFYGSFFYYSLGLYSV